MLHRDVMMDERVWSTTVEYNSFASLEINTTGLVITTKLVLIHNKA